MMRGQENAPNPVITLIVILKWIFFFITIFVIWPIKKGGVRDGWVFPIWGLIIAGLIHFILYEGIVEFTHLFAIPVYVFFLIVGICIWRVRVRKNILVPRASLIPTKLR